MAKEKTVGPQSASIDAAYAARIAAIDTLVSKENTHYTNYTHMLDLIKAYSKGNVEKFNQLADILTQHLDLKYKDIEGSGFIAMDDSVKWPLLREMNAIWDDLESKLLSGATFNIADFQERYNAVTTRIGEITGGSSLGEVVPKIVEPPALQPGFMQDETGNIVPIPPGLIRNADGTMAPTPEGKMRVSGTDNELVDITPGMTFDANRNLIQVPVVDPTHTTDQGILFEAFKVEGRDAFYFQATLLKEGSQAGTYIQNVIDHVNIGAFTAEDLDKLKTLSTSTDLQIFSPVGGSNNYAFKYTDANGEQVTEYINREKLTLILAAAGIRIEQFDAALAIGDTATAKQLFQAGATIIYNTCYDEAGAPRQMQQINYNNLLERLQFAGLAPEIIGEVSGAPEEHHKKKWWEKILDIFKMIAQLLGIYYGVTSLISAVGLSVGSDDQKEQQKLADTQSKFMSILLALEMIDGGIGDLTSSWFNFTGRDTRPSDPGGGRP